MIKLKPLIISILIPLIFGGIGALIGNIANEINSFNQPNFTPPAIVFPIAWSILYILMGISSYLIYTSDATNSEKKEAFVYYGIQLILNTLWNLVFFKLKLFLSSFIWILVLLLFVIILIIKFYKIRKSAGYLQIPYAIWLVFASIINYFVYTLN